MIVLTVNAGSSSIRLAAMESSGSGLRNVAACHRAPPPEATARTLQDLITGSGMPAPQAVAHRIVHGGEELVAACLIDAKVQAGIDRLTSLAPLHNPASLDWIHACRALWGPAMPQVAVFDTAFFADLPAVAREYALPRALTSQHHLRRFGFHGLAHKGMIRRWRMLTPQAAPDARVISLQLGAGCSITASRGGVPVDTSMGFSPLEGLMMATRGGDIDPGLLLHLLRELAMTPDDLDQLLNRQSGLLGVSGSSGDMRKLLASGTPAAELAIDMYCYRARKYVGAYLAALGGADAILFGGGVGENAPLVREKILAGLQWAGIELDATANLEAIGTEMRISAAGSAAAPRTAVWTLSVDEASILAEEALGIVDASAPVSAPTSG